jgi:glycosyltransferase involved in cell wall biosynthesis/4-amino-4-deoxy-L-arabinose transferase-like glycosyltransferase
MRFLYFGIYDPDFSRNRIYMRALRGAGHEVSECRDAARGPMKYIRLAYRLWMARGIYDVLLVGYPGHAVVPIAQLLSQAPVVADLLGSLSDAVARSHGGGPFERMRLTLIDWLAVRSADSVLVESEAQRAYMTSRFGGADKYSVVYSGCDEAVFAPRPNGAQRKEKCVVLFRGRLTPESGIMYILDAAERLRVEPSIQFRIIGYGRLLGAVKDRLSERQLTNVELISEHLTFERMHDLMLDATVSLGQFESNDRIERTIPHKMFESMSMGIPYITAHAPAASELLEDDVSALMVPQADSTAIADAILRIKNDPSLGQRLSREARHVFQEKSSQRVVAHSIASIVSGLPKRSMSHAGEFSVFSLALAAFAAIRFFGLSLPYHQDEWKNAEMVRIGMEGGLSAHPPLMEAIYQWSGVLFGVDNLRLMPLVFGILSAILLYAVVRRRAGVAAAFFATAFYTVSSYCVLASLMLDMDGTILPTFFLASVYAYDRFRDSSTRTASLAWLVGVGGFLVLGFLTKLSFVLVFGALALDYLLEKRSMFSVSLLARLGFLGVASVALGALLLWLADVLLSAFDVMQTIAHAQAYVRFEGRGYMQILIQTVKAVFYLSPILILAPIFLSKDTVQKSRVFLIYLVLGFIFYFILFDFSTGALDKYLMYTIVPLCAIAGVVLTPILSTVSRREILRGLLLGGAGSMFLVAGNLFPHIVMPLYPKTAWLTAVAAGQWNILMPFTGGNGPLGFYMSFLVIACGFGMSMLLVLAALFFAWFRRSALVALMTISIAFNALFIEELIWGGINGSAPTTLSSSVAYIQEHNIRNVITHADAGAYELNAFGAYVGRFYAVPAYEEGHRERFSKHTGMYLVVDMPHLNENGFYSRYFTTCVERFKTSSGVIDAYVYDCAGSDPYAIK